jgi:phosphotransferase system enzyme I (PtsI)
MRSDRVLRGIGVSPGVAFGSAMIIRFDFPDVPNRTITAAEVEDEIRRLREAVAQVGETLAALRDSVLERAGVEESRIFDAQILMAQDEEVLGEVETLIRNNLLSAETAYEFKALETRALWSSAANSMLRERLADLSGVQIRMLKQLTGQPDEEPWLVPSADRLIVVAHELYPGLTVQLDRDHVVGLVSEEGTRTAHAAILAHSLGIPAVMGAFGALSRIESGTLLLIDGQSGTIIIEPTRAEQEQVRVQISRRRKLEFELEHAVRQPATTPDGHQLTLMGNVDLPEEIDLAVRHHAEGVGLLRTEFLVLGRTTLPTEDEQADYFRRVSDAFPGYPVVIRSFDLGGDKFPAAFRASPEANPFLGWRSIRVCLDNPEIFRTQIRAVLRAAADRRIQLMLPLIIREEEVTTSRSIVEEEATALAAAGVRAAAAVPVGVMVETPAAVMIADQLASVSDFFSVGTNDLVQYTLAVDRGNARLAARFTPHHPAVIRLLRQVLKAGQAAGIPVSICGEMASDPLSCVLLIGLGYSSLSVGPPALPLVKWVIRTVPLSVAQEAAEAALGCRSAEAVTQAVREAVKHYVDVRLLDLETSLPVRGGKTT